MGVKTAAFGVNVANFGVLILLVAAAPPKPRGVIMPGVIMPPIIIGELLPIPPGNRFLDDESPRLGGGAIKLDNASSLGFAVASSFGVSVLLGVSSFFPVIGGGANGLPTSAGSSPGKIHPVGNGKANKTKRNKKNKQWE